MNLHKNKKISIYPKTTIGNQYNLQFPSPLNNHIEHNKVYETRTTEAHFSKIDCKIPNSLALRRGNFTPFPQSEIAFLSNSKWINRKERSHRSTEQSRYGQKS